MNPVVRANESSGTMIPLDSGTDVLISAFDSITFTECPEWRRDVAGDTSKTGFVGSLCEADSRGWRTGEGNNTERIDYSDFAAIIEPSTSGLCEAEGVNDIHDGQKQNQPLTVYTSSQGTRVNGTNAKLNQNVRGQPSKSNKGIATGNSVLDLSTLRFLKGRRSSTRARSSAWETTGNILPDFDKPKGLEIIDDRTKLRSLRGGKRNAIIKKKGRKSVQKSCTSKIKIGSQICTDAFGLSAISERKFQEKAPAKMVLPYERSLGKVNLVDTIHHDIEGTISNSSLSSSSNLYQMLSHEVGNDFSASTEDICLDPGTSPDSEAANSSTGTKLCEEGSQDIQNTLIRAVARRKQCFSKSVPDSSSWNVLSSGSRKIKSIKEHEEDKCDQSGDCMVDNKLPSAETTNNAKASVELGPGQKAVDVSYCSNVARIVTARPYLHSYNSDGISRIPSHCLSTADLGPPCTTSKIHSGAGINPSSGPVVAIESTDCQASELLLSCRNGKNFPKFTREKGEHKSRTVMNNLTRKKDEPSKKKGNKIYVVGKHKNVDKDGSNGIIRETENHLASDNQTSSDGETGDRCNSKSGSQNNLQLSPGGLRDQCASSGKAWVCCDKCKKWRRIPHALLDQVNKAKWTCRNNMDKDFADCSIPQEKSDAEIDEELGICDASRMKDAFSALQESNQNRTTAAQKSPCLHIQSNVFLHRSHKNQIIDEVMVCHCKPPLGGKMGCSAKCLNRMLNIECVQGTCPCGELCSNQQFQKCNYAKLQLFKCGKKGLGLRSLEDISEGQFLIEYVGEVLDMHSYEARQRDYALQGHKHFYFMTLNGSEVIDACQKGNFARFINHSCDPNCRTEKWMVNGEICIGLFAVRDIKKGEEVTFDYNYVRVLGAAAKKCVCGSPNCQGYIGGEPTNFEMIAQDDSDDEYTEPVMVCEDREMNKDWKELIPNSMCGGESEPPENRCIIDKLVKEQCMDITSQTLIQKVGASSASPSGSPKTTDTPFADTTVQDKHEARNSCGNDFTSNATVGQLGTNKDVGESSLCSASVAFKVESEGLLPQMQSSVQLVDASFQSENITNKGMSSTSCSVHELGMTTATMPYNLIHDETESRINLKYGTEGGKPELSKLLAKSNSLSSSIRKGKLKPNAVNDKVPANTDNSNTVPHRSKKMAGVSLNSHIGTVEEKLNELLDSEGGISKRREASRGYLKLLFLTAASGHHESIQSNRDLSMILDALLKTKSQAVLVDIISKNGLQMLHNIMKQYRRVFVKIPILRKLLKVLEYLAERGILLLKHIAGGPPCHGVESFKDSILILTEHDDKQVHQIARNFRDKWIPWHLRKKRYVKPDDGKIEFRRWSHPGRLLMSPCNDMSDHGRKPAKAIECCEKSPVVPVTVETLNADSALGGGGTNGTRTHKRKSRWDIPAEGIFNPERMASLLGDENSHIEDFPPGFSSPCNDSKIPAKPSSTVHPELSTCVKHPYDTMLGDSQQRFIAHMPISYGIPSSVMRQFGVLTPESTVVRAVASGFPFHPFPPLPPCYMGDPPSSATKYVSSSKTTETAEGDKKRSRTSSNDSQEIHIPEANDYHDFQREGISPTLVGKYFKQQKANTSKLASPLVRMGTGWDCTWNTQKVVPGVGL